LGIGEHKIPGGVERERDQEKSEREREIVSGGPSRIVAKISSRGLLASGWGKSGFCPPASQIPRIASRPPVCEPSAGPRPNPAARPDHRPASVGALASRLLRGPWWACLAAPQLRQRPLRAPLPARAAPASEPQARLRQGLFQKRHRRLRRRPFQKAPAVSETAPGALSRRGQGPETWHRGPGAASPRRAVVRAERRSRQAARGSTARRCFAGCSSSQSATVRG